MDVIQLLSPLLGLWYLLPIFIIITIVKTPWFKGVWGEFIVNVIARIKLDRDKYHLVKDITLRTEDGTTQIDHLIVSIYGVFVVETKNMKGWIFGSKTKQKWTQQIYHHKNTFQNPLHQNHKHVKTLQSLLNLEDHQVHSLIVFIGDSQFKTTMPANVTYGMGYIKYILTKTDPVLTPKQTLIILQSIELGRLARSYITNQAHVQHVKALVTEKETNKAQFYNRKKF